ncbi:MAG: EF-hand domain-containing protein [Planctomycetota bacterium]|jgi:Ca2+-binding EF-hand superfamily protein
MIWRRGLLFGMIVAGASMAIAQDPSEKPERRERPNRPGLQGQNPEMMARGMAMMMRNLPVIKALDVDEDGQLSATEIENASKSLMKLDKNGDGVISSEEMRPEPGQMPMVGGPGGPGGPGAGGPGAGGPPGGAAGMMRMLEARDKDKDGKLSGDEIPEQMRPRLSMIDENGDGSIDKSELEKMAARMQGPRMQGQGAGGRRERQGGGEGVKPRRPPSGDENPAK